MGNASQDTFFTCGERSKLNTKHRIHEHIYVPSKLLKFDPMWSCSPRLQFARICSSIHLADFGQFGAHSFSSSRKLAPVFARLAADGWRAAKRRSFESALLGLGQEPASSDAEEDDHGECDKEDDDGDDNGDDECCGGCS